MKILVVEASKKPVVVEIKDTLESMQEIVGGHIQVFYPFEESVAFICHDEGKLLDLPLNRGLRYPNSRECYDVIAGTFFICAAPEKSDEFESLSDKQIEQYQKRFEYPEEFIKLDGKIFCIPIKEGFDD